MIPFVLALALILSAAPVVPGLPQANPRVIFRTELGDITVEVAADKAPLTAANFLRYVDAGLYDGTTFHRTVTPSSPRNKPVPIEVIQGGASDRRQVLPGHPSRTDERDGLAARRRRRLHGPLGSRYGHFELLHLRRRPARARLRRQAQRRRPGLRRLRPGRRRDGSRPPHPPSPRRRAGASDAARQDSCRFPRSAYRLTGRA